MKLAIEIEELSKLKKDAERYRWLRDTGDATWTPFCMRHGYSAKIADENIDAAIAAQKSEV